MTTEGRPLLPYAGFWHRGLGLMLDNTALSLGYLVLGGALALLQTLLAWPGLVLLAVIPLALVLAVAYLTYCHARWGQTLGKWVAATEVQDAQGRRPTVRAALRRAVFACAALLLLRCLVGILDYLPVLWRTDRRALHDTFAGTFVRHRGSMPRGRLAISLIVAVAVMLLLARPYSAIWTGCLPAGSMAPTLRVNDRALANRLTYRLRAPRRGEIALFAAPPAADAGGKLFVKRVVGVPGDRVSVHDGKLWRNGVAVPEPYLREPIEYTWPTAEPDVRVPEGCVLVLGDNRNDSHDSHSWGAARGAADRSAPAPFVPLSNLKGEVVGVWYPLARAHSLK